MLTTFGQYKKAYHTYISYTYTYVWGPQHNSLQNSQFSSGKPTIAFYIVFVAILHFIGLNFISLEYAPVTVDSQKIV